METQGLNDIVGMLNSENSGQSNTNPPNSAGQTIQAPSSGQGQTTAANPNPTPSEGETGGKVSWTPEQLKDFKEKNPAVFAALKHNLDSEASRKIEAAKKEMDANFNLRIQEQINSEIDKLKNNQKTEAQQKDEYISQLKVENGSLKETVKERDKQIEVDKIKSVIKDNFLDGVRTPKMKELIIYDLLSKFKINEASEVVPITNESVTAFVKRYKEQENPEMYAVQTPTGAGIRPQGQTNIASFDQSVNDFLNNKLNLNPK